MPDEAATKCVLQSIVTFFGGGFVGAILGHFLAIGRDSRNRKHAAESARKMRIRDAKSFMSGFRSWIERAELTQLERDFHGRVNQFRQEIALVRDDIPETKRAQFDNAVESLCRLTMSQVGEYDIKGENVEYIGKKRLATAIDTVVGTLE
jgi:hypothetical protein